MLKISSEFKIEKGDTIYIKENWHEKILGLLMKKTFPYKFKFIDIALNDESKEDVYIFESVSKSSKVKIALSYNVIRYLYATEVENTNIGFSFEEYMPNENTDILITNNRNISIVQPANFDISLEEITLFDFGVLLYLDFRISYLNGNAFTSLSYYTKSDKATWKFLFSKDISYMTDYERMFQDTFIHRKYMKISCEKFSKYLISVGADVHAKSLMERADIHDLSKITCDDELRALSMIINDKSNLKDAKIKLTDIKKDSIRLHHKHNSHHPEYYKTCIDMSKLDIMEMVCDWYARSLQMGTNFLEYVRINQENRFKFPEWMFAEIWHYCEILAKEE